MAAVKTTAGYAPTIEEPTPTIEVYIPTVIPTSTNIPTLTIEPTPTVTPSPTPIPTLEILEEGIYEVTLNGEDMLKDLEILTCSDECDYEEITELFRHQESHWKIVQDHQILHTHSGRFTNLPWDMEFGEVLRQLYLKDSLQDALICITNTKCLQVVDAVVASHTNRSVSSFDLFPILQTNDFVLVTCIEPSNPHSSERLFILLRMID